MVVFYTVFWGTGMWVWEARKRKLASLRPVLLPASLLGWTLAGLGFGLLMEFRWRAVHWPLVIMTGATFTATFTISILSSRERSKAFDQRQSWQRVVSFFLMMAGLGLLLVDRVRPVAYVAFIAVGVLSVWGYLESRNREAQSLSK
jgi:hypothetical protein